MLAPALARPSRSRLVSLVALAAPLWLAAGCTEHRSIFAGDGGVDAGSDGGSDGGTDGGPLSDGGTLTLRIDGLNGPVQQGTTTPLQVIELDGAGGQTDVTAQATLSSSNSGVATFSSSAPADLVAVARGTALISASLAISGGAPLTAQTLVVVQGANQNVTVSVEIAPATLTLAPGLGSRLAANATQGDGSQLSVGAQADWSSSDATICTVDNAQQKGFVSAVATGSCTITATYGGKSGTAAVTVSALTPTALAVNPSTAQVAAGATAQLTATATLSDGSAFDATASASWSSAAAGTASVQSGLVTGVATGQTQIIAALGSLTASAQITVTAATLQSISVAPPQSTLAAGLVQQLTATAVYSDGSTADATGSATWTSSAPAIAMLESTASDGSTGGTVLALTPGRATITATLSGVSGSALVNVTDATPTLITLTPSPITLPAGVSQQITARALFSDNTTRDVSSAVTWQLADTTLATINGSGLLTGTLPGSTTLTATLGTASASANLTVTAAQLAQVLLTPQNAAVPVGGTQAFAAMGIYGDNSIHDVSELATWTSSSDAIATVSNASGTRGLSTGVSAGTAQITAAVGAITSSPASLTVSAAALSSITIAPHNLLTTVYVTLPLSVTARYADGSQLDVTAQALFTSADPTIASVVAAGADAGQVTGVAQGRTSVTASFGGQTATANVNVANAVLQSITVTAPGQRGGGNGPGGGGGGGTPNPINVGQSAQLRATAQFQGAPGGIDVTTLVTWSSSDTSIGTFVATPNGLFTAQSPGTTTVAAALDGISGTLALTVAAVSPVSIAVVQSAVSLPVGVARALVAIGTYPDSSTEDLTYAATWSSDANAIAVVGDTGVQKGLVTAVSTGTAHVTATLGSISGSSTITVNSANATAISVTPVNPVVTSGGNGGNGGNGGGGGGFQPTANYPFYATAQFDDGTQQDVTQSAVWTSSDPSVATISDQTGTRGVANIISAGGTTITATFRGLTGNTFLTSR